jgi:hypothetical protein
LSLDNEALSLDNEALSLDNRSLSLDNEALSLDNRSLSLDNEALSLDNEALSFNHDLLQIKNRPSVVTDGLFSITATPLATATGAAVCAQPAGGAFTGGAFARRRRQASMP